MLYQVLVGQLHAGEKVARIRVPRRWVLFCFLPSWYVRHNLLVPMRGLLSWSEEACKGVEECGI